MDPWVIEAGNRMNTLSVGTRTVSVRSASSLGVEIFLYLNVSWLLVNDYILRIMQYSLQSQETWFADSGLVQDIAAGNAVEPYGKGACWSRGSWSASTTWMMYRLTSSA